MVIKRSVIRAARASACLLVTFSPLQAQRSGQHPDARSVVAPAAPTVEIKFADPQGTAEMALSPAALATIGTEGGAPPTVFSSMTSAIFVDDTTVAIIDEAMHEVRVFTTTGRYLQTVGRDGRGPGEFRRPVAIAMTPTGQLLVSDTQRKLHVFARGPNGFAFDHAIPMTVSISSMCYMGDVLYVSGATLEDVRLIRAIDGEGKITASFGMIYNSSNPMINWQVAQGRIACDGERGLVLYMAGSLLGEVRAYRTSGELVWRVRVPEYRTNIIHDVANGFQMERSPVGVDADASLVRVTESGVLAQWTFRSVADVEAKAAASQVNSVWIDVTTGTASYLGSAIPRIAATRSGTALVLSPEPIPQLMVHSLMLRR